MKPTGPAGQVTVAWEEGSYCCFPDVVRTEAGTLLCVYRQSDNHWPERFSHIALRESRDDGHTWAAPPVLAQSRRESDSYRFHWNCPRIGQAADGRLWVLCDGFPVPPAEEDLSRSRVFIWWSGDGGRTWEGPQETPIVGIVPDRLRVLPGSGDWLVGTHVQNRATGNLMQTVWRSGDAGLTWTGPVTVCDDGRYNACEACLLPLPGGEGVVAYLRENSGRGWPALKCLSRDGGRTWAGPYPTLIAGCHRPVAGLLADGRILLTYRWDMGGRSPNRNFYAYTEAVASALAADLPGQSGEVCRLDYDRHPEADTGYSGWVPLPDGRLFCVNYIRDDCPQAQIRGYWLDPSELFPNIAK